MFRMYVVVNKDLGMSLGKTAAQVAHAVARIRSNKTPHIMIVLQAGTEQLHNLQEYLNNLGIQNHLYIDEGVNEVPPYSVTALAVEPFYEENQTMKDIFSGFQLLSGKKGWFK